jgi:pyridoxine 5-phosphate synthase
MVKDGQRVSEIVAQLKDIGIRVSLFMDPDKAGIEIAAKAGADRVELYTEPYAKAFASGTELEKMTRKYAEAAKYAVEIGLGLNAGHDLNLKNLGFFCRNVKGVLEVSIGHALIADALEMGLSNAVKAYLKVLSEV